MKRKNMLFILLFIFLRCSEMAQLFSSDPWHEYQFALMFGKLFLVFLCMAPSRMYIMKVLKSIMLFDCTVDMARFLLFPGTIYEYLIVRNAMDILISLYWYRAFLLWEKISEQRIQLPGVYIISRQAQSGWDYIGSLFGGPPGECVIMIKEKDDAGTYFWTDCKGRYYHESKPHNYRFQVKLPIEDTDGFKRRCSEHIGDKFNYNPIIKNCLTSWAPAFKDFGIHISYLRLEFIPSVFMRKYGQKWKS